jgi:hypothetical protein
MIIAIIFAAAIALVIVAIILFIKKHKSNSQPITPAPADSPEYLQALDSLSTTIRGNILTNWTSFLATASNRQSLIDPRDTFESFPQYFPDNVGMAADSLSGKKITDPYELLLFYVNGIYKSIGDYGDNASQDNENACITMLKNAATTFGYTSMPSSITCGSNSGYILNGLAKLEGTSMTWDDYFNLIKTSSSASYQHEKIKYQYWIKGISPLSSLNDLDNMALLIISQCTSALSIFNDLLKIVPAASGFLTGSYKSDNSKITNFHELRKVLRSLVRTFTEFCESSPLTYYEGCPANSAALACTTVPCCTAAAATTPVAACMKNLSGSNFVEIMKTSNNPKLISLTAIALLGEKGDCDFDKNCNSTCTTKGCSNVSNPNAGDCGITECAAADGSDCDWKKCDLVSWFGNIHDNMVQYLPALQNNYSNINQLRVWINQDVSNIIVYLKLYLPKYLYYIMFSSWKESFTRACQSAPGQKMLRGPSDAATDGWLCWNDSLDALGISEYKITNCNYI